MRRMQICDLYRYMFIYRGTFVQVYKQASLCVYVCTCMSILFSNKACVHWACVCVKEREIKKEGVQD